MSTTASTPAPAPAGAAPTTAAPGAALSPAAPASIGSGIPLIVGTLLSWASIPLFLKYFAKPDPVTNLALIDGFTANGWRYGIAALFWLPLLTIAFRRGKMPAGIFRAALWPTAFNLVGQTAFAWCPYFLEPGFFTFVFRVQIIFVTVGAYLLFPSERATLRTPRFWIGALLVVAGSVGLIALKPAGLGTSASGWAIALALASGAIFACYGLAVRKTMHGYPSVLAFGVICQYTAVGTIILMLLFGRERGADVFHFSGFHWFMLVLSAMIGIAFSHVMYYSAIQKLGVSVSMGIIQLQPVITAGASVLMGWEVLSLWQWGAGLVGVAGAIIMLLPKRSGKEPEVMEEQ